MARSFRPAVGSGFTTARIFAYIDSAMAASDCRSSSSLFLKWRYIAPLVKPVASVMSLTDVAWYPRVLNSTAERCRIRFFVYSGLRMPKDTNRYLSSRQKLTELSVGLGVIDLIVPDEQEDFASLVAGYVEGVVGNLYEVCVGDALEQHRAPLVVDIQISERRKREPASVADLIDTQHGTSEAVGVDSACAPVAGEGKHDGSFYLNELSVDRPGLGVVIVREFPPPIQGKGLFIAGGP